VNVLSLFDGMSCGQIALERAGVAVENYFASEVDKYAIEVTKKNYPNTIHLGDVTKWNEWDLPEIDLLIGGSPCQGFSFAGKQLNFGDPRSRLFFEYVGVLNKVKPKYFLLENVKMKKEYQDVISDHLGVEPVEINSSLVSAQNRVRLYWTNIPNITQPIDKNLYAKDILESETPVDYILSEMFKNRFEKSKSNHRKKKFPTTGKIKILGTTVNDIAAGTNSSHWVHDINTKMGCLSARDYKQPKQIIDQHGELRKLTPLEFERLQTVPDNYTDSVSKTQRYKMLGNGWTVDVIAHILSGIK
jgi:site-specific DNA-cytosine methylase